MRTNTRLQTTTLDLQLEVFNRQFMIEKTEYLNRYNTKFETYLHHEFRGQVCRLQHFVYCGKPVKETHEVKYPAGWWNAFKAEYPRLCCWFAPVKYATVKVQWEGRLAFPSIEVNSGFGTIPIWKNCVITEEIEE